MLSVPAYESFFEKAGEEISHAPTVHSACHEVPDWNFCEIVHLLEGLYLTYFIAFFVTLRIFPDLEGVPPRVSILLIAYELIYFAKH